MHSLHLASRVLAAVLVSLSESELGSADLLFVGNGVCQDTDPDVRWGRLCQPLLHIVPNTREHGNGSREVSNSPECCGIKGNLTCIRSVCQALCDSSPTCEFYSVADEVQQAGWKCQLYGNCPSVASSPGDMTYMRSCFSSWDAFTIESAYGVAQSSYLTWLDAAWTSRGRHRRHVHELSLSTLANCCARRDSSACRPGGGDASWFPCAKHLIQLLEQHAAPFVLESTSPEDLPDDIPCAQHYDGPANDCWFGDQTGTCSLWGELAAGFPLNALIWAALAKRRALQSLRAAHKSRATDISRTNSATPSVQSLFRAMGFLEVTMQLLSSQRTHETISADSVNRILHSIVPLYRDVHQKLLPRIYGGDSLESQAMMESKTTGPKSNAHRSEELHVDYDTVVHVAFVLAVPRGGRGGGSMGNASNGFGSVSARATVGSLLHHATAKRIIFYVLGDASSTEELQRFFARDTRAEFKTVDPEGAKPWLQRLPRACVKDNPSADHWGDVRVLRAVMSRLFMHELLPHHVRRLLIVDVGDVLVLGDVKEVFERAHRGFQLPHVSIAMVPHMALERVIAAKARERAEFNGGLVVLDLARIRAVNISAALIAAAHRAVRRQQSSSSDACSMLDQDVWNELLRPPDWRRRLFALPCTWNYLPVRAASGDIFLWNRQEMWSDVARRYHIFPGLLRADRMIHHCGKSLERFGYSMTWALSNSDFGGLRQIAQREGRLATLRRTLLGCGCGAEVKMLHAMGSFRSYQWVRELFAFWSKKRAPHTHE